MRTENQMRAVTMGAANADGNAICAFGRRVWEKAIIIGIRFSLHLLRAFLS